MTKVFRKHLEYGEELQIGPYVSIHCTSTYKGEEAPPLHRKEHSYSCDFREWETTPEEAWNPPQLQIRGITQVTSRVTDDVAVINYPSLYEGRASLELRGRGILCELKEPSISQRELFCSNSERWISGEAIRRIAREMGREEELAWGRVGKKKLTLIDVELD